MIDGLLLREMFAAGVSLLEQNKEAVDALNVFPVPDGDTGTNMSLTVISALREASIKESMSATEVAESIAKGALRGARGNSGVITSQLMRGFARGIAGKQEIDARDFAAGLKAGAETAYKAMMKPKEGTILTVARVVAEEAAKQAERNPDDLKALFLVMLTAGEAILRKTPDMLPALKQAGVVDAGGRGLLLIYNGMNAALNGQTIAPVTDSMQSDGKALFIDDHDSISEIKYAYCTEFLVQNLSPSATEEDILTLRRRLNRIGDCVLVVGDISLVKVHVHTNDPGKALQSGLALGELIGLKIENMVEQRREKAREQVKNEEKQYGIIAVSQGEGFSKIFRDLNALGIVEGGQTMNPSIEDLAKAIDSANAKVVYVLPNNSNVILAAREACELAKREAYAVPTKNVAMGIAAAVALQDNLSVTENLEAMEEAANRVDTVVVTRAIRDSQYGDIVIHNGDVIGLTNGVITAAGDDEGDLILKMLDDMNVPQDALITLYWGEGAGTDSAEGLVERIRAQHDDCDVEILEGGQPVYPYIVSVE